MSGRAEWIRGQIFAHRGLHSAAVPENSPAAFEAAIARGLGIECDVQASRDWQAMVFHDWELDRLTDETGPLLERDAAEIGGVTLSANGEAIPDLPHLLELIGGRAALLIEIKSRRGLPVEQLCRSVGNALADYDGDAAVMSFDPRAARWFADHAPDIVRGLVVTEEGKKGPRGAWERRLALRHSRAEFLAYDIRDLPSRFAARARARGLPVASWTVRTPELRERAAQHADAPIAEGDGLA